jgi:hypothetical protein
MKNQALNNRVWIKGLVMECPKGTPLHDCPMNGLRSLPISQANKTINGLSADSLKALIVSHRVCYHHRMKEEKYPVL